MMWAMLSGNTAWDDPASPSIDPVEILVGTPLFAGLPADDLDALATCCRRSDVAAGQTVLREGAGDALYVLVRGRLRVECRRARVCTRFRPGELFGEIAVVTRKPRTTSIYAVRDSELLVLPAVAFEELVERKPDIFREVARVLVDRLLTVDRPVTAGNGSLVVAVVAVMRDPQLVEEALRELLQAFARYGSAACAAGRTSQKAGAWWNGPVSSKWRTGTSSTSSVLKTPSGSPPASARPTEC